MEKARHLCWFCHLRELRHDQLHIITRDVVSQSLGGALSIFSEAENNKKWISV